MPSIRVFWWKTTGSFFKTVLVTIPTHIIFDRNRQSMTSLWHYWRQTYGDFEKIPWVNMCEIDGEMDITSLVAISDFVLEPWKEKWRGPFFLLPIVAWANIIGIDLIWIPFQRTGINTRNRKVFINICITISYLLCCDTSFFFKYSHDFLTVWTWYEVDKNMNIFHHAFEMLLILPIYRYVANVSHIPVT